MRDGRADPSMSNIKSLFVGLIRMNYMVWIENRMSQNRQGNFMKFP
jgi:hypothetical protein